MNPLIPISEPSARHPIGIFDSGVGGLSVLRYLQAQLPQERYLYVADQVHVPYGPRPLDEIRRFSEGITRFLLAQQAKLIVVACNTASGSALTYLRQVFPHVPVVGMEPAVKPAARQTQSGKVGVLATTSTLESDRYVNLMARFAQGVAVFESPCPGLVGQIEAGLINTAETEAILSSCLTPMLAVGVDTIVLGCTHYPFVKPLIEQIVGPTVAIIDPAPAVARQVERVLQAQGRLASADQTGNVLAYTTGDPYHLFELGSRLLNDRLPVRKALWQDETLIAAL